MSRLLLVELRRLVHRRAVLVLAVAAIVIPAVAGISVALDHQAPSAQERADAQAQIDQQEASGEFDEMVQQCVADPAGWGIPAGLGPADLEAACREPLVPQLEWYLDSTPLDLDQERDYGSGIGVAFILVIMMLVAGTTFVGQDWVSGSVSNQLLFEPRRGRVWAAKAVVVTLAALVLAAAVFTAFWLALGAVASAQGSLEDGQLADALWMGLRGALIAAAAALCGMSLTMFFRSTVATLGLVFGFALAGTAVLAIFGIDGAWNPAQSVAAVLSDGTTYYAEVPCPGPGDTGTCSEERSISLAEGAWRVGPGLALVAAASLLSFRRRDVP